MGSTAGAEGAASGIEAAKRRLNDDLHQADVQALCPLDMMIPQMAKYADVTEQLKMTDLLRWSGMMNAIKQQVMESIGTRLSISKKRWLLHHAVITVLILISKNINGFLSILICAIWKSPLTVQGFSKYVRQDLNL